MNACACVPLCSIVVGQFSDLEEEQNQTAREERMLEYTKRFKQLQMSVAKRRIQAFFDKRKARVEAASQAFSTGILICSSFSAGDCIMIEIFLMCSGAGLM